MKVFVSAGHGGVDPGAVGNGLLEKDCNLYIALGFGKTLEDAGIDVVYSRIKDEYDPVTQEVIEANRCNADYAISFHNNAGGGIGSETYIYPGDKDSEKIARAFENVTVNVFNGKSRGVKTTNNLYFIRNTKMHAILNESAFVDNAKDAERIDTTDKCYRIGKAYAEAFIGLFAETVTKPSIGEPFQIKAKNKKLYVYKDTSRDSEVTYTIVNKHRYTVIATKEVNNENWFKLKSGAGWVNSEDVEVVL